MDLSKKGQRQITPFLAQQLLYDYATMSLDVERTESMERLLASSPELRAELENLRRGLNYAKELSETTVQPFICEKIGTPTTYFEVLLKNLRVESWSPLTRTVIEGVMIAVGIAVVALFVPWGRLIQINFGDRNTVLLAQVERGSGGIASEQAREVKTAPTDTSTQFPDESIHPGNIEAKVETSPKPVEKPVSQPKANPAEALANESKIVEVKSQLGKTQGFVFRGSIRVSNVVVTTEKLVEMITGLGGRKAGQVDLGWKKGTGSYFHFTIPEAKYEDMLKEFSRYGKLRISKQSHDRVMPEGILRVIIDVEEGAP